MGVGGKPFANDFSLRYVAVTLSCSLFMRHKSNLVGENEVSDKDQLTTLMHCALGEPIETMYMLRGYGIPSSQLPVSESGNVKTKNLLQWIRVRKMCEGTSLTGNDRDQAIAPIECPGSNDAIFRCGQAYLSHPGNVMFRSLIETKFDEHNLASSSEVKVSITWWIIEQVERNQGRFLIWDDGVWKQLTDKQQIRAKVAIALKDHKRRMRALANCKENESSTIKFEGQDGRKRKKPTGLVEDEESCTCVW